MLKKILTISSFIGSILFIIYNIGMIYTLSKQLGSLEETRVNQMKFLSLSRDLTNRLTIGGIKTLGSARVDDIITIIEIQKEFFESKKNLKYLKEMSKIINSKEIDEIIERLEVRISSFKFLIQSIIESMRNRDSIDIYDSIAGFNSLYLKYMEDLNTLNSKALELLDFRIKMLQKDMETQKYIILISPLLIIIFLIVALTLLNEEKRSEELKKQLYFDDLTELKNRNRLLEDIQDRLDTPPTLSIINIDNFKSINDFYGNIVGDKIIKDFATFLKEFIKDRDIELYRIWGDEFAFLSFSKEDISKCEKLMLKLLKELESKEFYFENSRIIFNASIGIARDSDSLLVKADSALDYTKKSKLKYTVYNKEMRILEEHQNNIDWFHRIKDSIKEDRVVPFFQPIINNKTGKVEKYECLIRIVCDSGEVISPFFFLDMSKKSKQYVELTKIMLKKCFKIFKDSKYEFSINLSVEDILDKSVVNYLEKKLSEDRNLARRLVIEIVESEGIKSYKDIVKFIDIVKSYGAQIAIDDFGSGYSNFEYLIEFKVDYLKIDGSLIKNIDRDKFSYVIVESIVNFTKNMQIKSVAEYIDSKEVLNIVKSLDIDYSQGFLFSKPKPTIEES